MKNKDRPMSAQKIERARQRKLWAEEQRQRLIRLGAEAATMVDDIKKGGPLPKGASSIEEATNKIAGVYLNQVKSAVDVVSGQSLRRAILFCKGLEHKTPFKTTLEYLQKQRVRFDDLLLEPSREPVINPPEDATAVGFQQLLVKAHHVQGAWQAKNIANRIISALDYRLSVQQDRFWAASLAPFLDNYYPSGKLLSQPVVMNYEKHLLAPCLRRSFDILRKQQPSLNPRQPHGLMTITTIRHAHGFLEHGTKLLSNRAAAGLNMLYNVLSQSEPEVLQTHFDGYLCSPTCPQKSVALIKEFKASQTQP